LAETAARLVGRTEELALIDSALADAEAGASVVLEVAGDPGIGKTRLLTELGSRAEEHRCLVLAGRASELERDLPYWIFVDALDEYLRTVESSWIETLDRSADGELSRIFPALAGAAAPPATVLDERYRVHRAVRTLLEELGGAHPLVLLLDDLHWADPASVDLVGSLIRRPPGARVLMAIALRSRQAPPRLAHVLLDARRTGELIHVEPRPLHEAEVEELLGPDVSPALARQLYDECGGNPFYLDQLARATGAARVDGMEASSSHRAGDVELPPAVAVALASELAELSTAARGLLEAAAVIGDPFELNFATATAGMEESDALVALDALLEAGLVHPTDVPRRFRFRHPILRRAVYDATGSAWRHAAHERAARALAAHGETPASRAHHVDQFAALGDRDAIRLFRDAADTSAERAPASAARWYRAALRLLPRNADDADERAALLGHLARVLAGIGQLEESRAALLELLALGSSQTPAQRVRATAACAALEHLLGRHDEAHARLVEALDQLPEQDSAEGAALMLDLAMDAYYTPDYEQMHAWGARALEVAQRLADMPLTAAAHAVICLGDAYGNRMASAEAHHAEARRLVDSLEDDDLTPRLDAVANLGNAEIYLCRYGDAVRHLGRGLVLGRATGQGQLFPLLTQGLGYTLTLIGRLDEAREHLDGALEAARLVDSPQSVAWALLNSSWATMLTGDLETARRMAEGSSELAREVDANPVTIWSTCALGAMLIESGEPARGVDVIRAGAGGPELEDIPGFFRVTVQEWVIAALLTLGRYEEADRAASHAQDWAEATGLALSRAQAARARAAVLLATGDARAAAARALEAAAAADEIDARIDAARSRTLAGRALHAAGERERAAEVLTAAAETLDDCGAIRYRDEAERELRRLGRRDHRRRGSERSDGEGLAALTARELEIARLVVDRRTNPEIAAELFLSQKTVESHLRNTFRKLGVSSRVELARAVERADRVS
jgi:DNA-binding CsgD family transcriptional regulator/tetratricopeptide (TPR) repeat protein